MIQVSTAGQLHYFKDILIGEATCLWPHLYRQQNGCLLGLSILTGLSFHLTPMDCISVFWVKVTEIQLLDKINEQLDIKSLSYLLTARMFP